MNRPQVLLGPRPASSQVCAMFAADIAGFTRPDRDGEIRGYLRDAFYDFLQRALAETSIAWDACGHGDCGDGALVTLPADGPAEAIISGIPERLRALIRQHNRVAGPATRIQLRVAATIGTARRDEHGLSGDDITGLFRMLDSRPLRRALAGSEAELAMFVSRFAYDSLVKPNPSLVDPALFKPIRAQVKRTRIRGWIYLPGAAP